MPYPTIPSGTYKPSPGQQQSAIQVGQMKKAREEVALATTKALHEDLYDKNYRRKQAAESLVALSKQGQGRRRSKKITRKARRTRRHR
jgi:hypothetical protein